MTLHSIRIPQIWTFDLRKKDRITVVVFQAMPAEARRKETVEMKWKQPESLLKGLTVESNLNLKVLFLKWKSLRFLRHLTLREDKATFHHHLPLESVYYVFELCIFIFTIFDFFHNFLLINTFFRGDAGSTTDSFFLFLWFKTEIRWEIGGISERGTRTYTRNTSTVTNCWNILTHTSWQSTFITGQILINVRYYSDDSRNGLGDITPPSLLYKCGHQEIGTQIIIRYKIDESNEILRFRKPFT